MRQLLTPAWLVGHALAAVLVVGMLWLGLWQYERATAGNALSWGYTLQWPLFAAFTACLWWREVRRRLRNAESNRRLSGPPRHHRPQPARPATRPPVVTRPGRPRDERRGPGTRRLQPLPSLVERQSRRAAGRLPRESLTVSGAFTRFRVIAHVVGVMLLLLTVGVVLRYGFDMPGCRRRSARSTASCTWSIWSPSLIWADGPGGQ